jgi:hypothetical protein
MLGELSYFHTNSCVNINYSCSYKLGVPLNVTAVEVVSIALHLPLRKAARVKVRDRPL